MPFGTVALERCLHSITIIHASQIYSSFWQISKLAEAEWIVCKIIATCSCHYMPSVCWIAQLFIDALLRNNTHLVQSV